MSGISSTDASHFEQLDDYSLMNIFDYLLLSDLIAVAQMNPRFADIIQNRYLISKYRFHEREINGFTRIAHSSLHYIDKRYYYHYITKSLDETLFVLKQFGHIFKQLRHKVDDFGGPDSQKILEYSDKFCPQAAKMIKICSVDYEPLANWTYSFDETTTHIIIEVYFDYFVPLNVLYPRMKQLTVNNLSASMVQHYPNLTSFSIISRFNDPHVPGFVRLNPQLSYFHAIVSHNASNVEYLNEMLPNMKSLGIRLEVRTPNFNSKIVRFRNVKEFRLDASVCTTVPEYWNAIDNIQFDQLEVLKLAISTYSPERIVEIIIKNRGLKKVEVDFQITEALLLELVGALPQLEELTVRFYDGILNSLRTILGNYGINTLNIVSCYSQRMSSEDFLDFIPTNWQVVPKQSILRMDKFSLIRSIHH